MIAHEWLEPRGGAENVIDEFRRIFPDADLVTLWNDAPERFGADVRESWLARTPLRRHKALALPFMPATWAGTRFGSPDFVLLSSHAFAHHADWRNRADAPRFVYTYTPARYLWAPEVDPRGTSLPVRMAGPALRALDRRVARAQDARFAGISHYVRERMERAWGVEAEVIYPPVDVERLQSVSDWSARLSGREADLFATLPEGFLLGASRFVSYKQLDKVIDAGEATGRPVVLAGSGPMRDELAARGEAASVPVTIIDRPSDEFLYALYQAAAVFVFLAIEDFGIMPIEAMALGTPVLSRGSGGVGETIRLTGGGAVVSEDWASALPSGVEQALGVDTQAARLNAARLFGRKEFAQNVQRWVSQ